MLFGKQVSYFRGVGVYTPLSLSARFAMVTFVVTLVSVVVTRFCSNLTNFQLKMLLGKQVSNFSGGWGGGVHPYPYL